MVGYRVNREIKDRDEVNGDYFELNSYGEIEDGELSQSTEWVQITIYELKPRKKQDFAEGKFEKVYKGSAKISKAALQYMIGD